MKVPAKIWGSSVALVAFVIASTVDIEGVFVNHPADPGGATNHGITERVARSHGYKGDMQDMPREYAEWVYATDYIDRPGFDKVLMASPAVGHKTVDAGVNAGPGRSAKWLQESLNHLNQYGQNYPMLTVDGRIGAQTIAAFNALERKRGRTKACEMVLKLMDAQQASHYMKLRKAPFIVGWVDHRVGNVPLSRCDERVGGGDA